MIKFVLLAVDFRGRVHHCVHNPSYHLLHEASLIITVNDDRTLHVAKDRGDTPRDVTPDEALALVNKYIARAEKHA